MLKASISKKMAKRIAAGVIGTATATGLGLTLAMNGDLMANDHGIKPAKYPWFHSGLFNTYDHASIRRGYEVYKQVCAACHSMKYTHYRQLVNVSHTEEEAKAEAAEAEYKDGPNDAGEMYTRSGKLSDPFPSPYPNDEAAKSANNGALPPDLSLIALARNGGIDYIFALLTGYVDPPAGVEVKEGLHYNPYFPNSWIGMAKALYDEVIEYSDGTPATTSQLAKDVATFLNWSSEKQHDDRKKLIFNTLWVGPPLVLLFWLYKRRVFTSMKSRKIVYSPPSSKPTNGGGKH